MRAERLFSILGLVDPELIDEAMADTRAVRIRWAAIWGRYAAIAACCAIVCGALFWSVRFLGIGGGSDSAATTESAADTAEGADSGDTAGAEAEEGNTAPESTDGFLSYAGPVLPLTTLETDTGLTAERTLTFDFTPGTYEDGTARQWGARVTDHYVLNNPTDSDLIVTALYPVTGSLAGLTEMAPDLTVDGEPVSYTLYAGSYAGSFQDAGVDDGSTWNLADPASWEDYAALLNQEAYQAQALGDSPDLSTPVTVYRFSDFEAPHAEYRAATQAVEFTIDPSVTTILSYGFNGLSQDTESGWRQYDYFVPDGIRNEPELKLLVVLGEDIAGYTLQGYADGACQQAIDGVSCTVTRQETTLDAVLAELCQAVITRHQGNSWDFSALPLSVYEKAAAELLMAYGLLSGAPMDRYTDGRLDDLLWDVLVQSRILYLAVPVTIPAGGSTTVETVFWKEPSYDFGGSGTGREDLQGFEALTTAGSSLTFTGQTASLVNGDGIEVAAENFGFRNDGTADLSLMEPHYFLEVRVSD